MNAFYVKYPVMKKELWKPHPLTNKYLISSKGNVLTLQYGEPQPFKPQLKSGYPFINIALNNGKKRQFLVHRLVAELFLESQPDKNFVNHKNGNPVDNRLENLEWCTHKENRLHACRVLDKGRGENHGNSKLKLKEVRIIKALLIRKIGTHREIAAEFNVARSNITRIARGLGWGFALPNFTGIELYRKSILEKRRQRLLKQKKVKLTGEQVILIRSLKHKLSQRAIAKNFNIRQSTVNSILLNKIWRL